MDPVIKQRWVEALESGQYAKGINQLRRIEDNTYCCLGVLCDLYGKDHGIEWSQDGGCMFLGHAADLPRVVAAWAGLSQDPIDSLIHIEHHPVYTSLAHVNDVSESFAPVVEVIKEYF